MNAQWDPPPCPVLTSEACSGLLPALQLLGEAYACAQELGRSTWDFAVEIGNLHSVGLTGSGLRWLVCKGYAEHAAEFTSPGTDVRCFRPVGMLTITERTCVVLTCAGADLARRSGVAVPGRPSEGRQLAAATWVDVGPQTPRWDGLRRQLWVDSALVKHFRQPASSQERILAAFQEDGWPPRIDDPLPLKPEIDPKQHLRDTIKNI